MGRKLGSSELQLVILALIEERPRHGYEIIKALEETSKGFYTPSPGMVYPALTYLEELGCATVETEGTKKLYQITDAGRAMLEDNRVMVDAILAQLARVGSKMERVRQMFTRDEPGDVGHRAVDEARNGLARRAHRQAQRVAFRRGIAARFGSIEAGHRRASTQDEMTTRVVA